MQTANLRAGSSIPSMEGATRQISSRMFKKPEYSNLLNQSSSRQVIWNALLPPRIFWQSIITRAILSKPDRNHTEDPTSTEPVAAPGGEHTDIGWEVYPSGLFEILSRVYWTYKPAEIIISENGASYADGPDEDGHIHDQRRIDYLRAHIQQVGKAIQTGIPVNGYYLWSLMDNFEWSMGYSQRFGISACGLSNPKTDPQG